MAIWPGRPGRQVRRRRGWPPGQLASSARNDVTPASPRPGLALGVRAAGGPLVNAHPSRSGPPLPVPQGGVCSLSPGPTPFGPWGPGMSAAGTSTPTASSGLAARALSTRPGWRGLPARSCPRAWLTL